MERLPSWAAGLEPVGFSWGAKADPTQNALRSSALQTLEQGQQQPQSGNSSFTAASNAGMSSKRSDDSTQDRLSEDRPGWDPAPCMPQVDKEEALEFMSDYGVIDSLHGANLAGSTGTADLPASAPAHSDIGSAEDDSKTTLHDSVLPRALSQPYTTEQKQIKARESQKRFRQRQKARSQAIEARLASTAAELHNLKVRQKQLENRNMLLEKSSCAGNKQNQFDGDGLYERLYIVHETDALESGPSITISVQGERRNMTVQEISQLSLKHFAFLWTEYVRKIGACLVQLEQTNDSNVRKVMETLTTESSRLIGCVKLLNHDLHKAMLAGKMDESLSNSHKLGAAFYSNLTRMLNLSEEQKADMLHLRRLYLTRRSLHAMERQALLSQAAVSRDQMPLPSDNLTQIQDLAARLQKNAADDYRVYHRIACAGRRGVFTIKQWAILIVQSYPYLPILETHMEAMAAEAGAPNKAQIVAAAQTNPMAAEWRQLNKFLENIASMNCNEYIPLLPRPAQNNALGTPLSGAAVPYTSQEEMAAAAERAGTVSRSDSSGLFQEPLGASTGLSHQSNSAAVGVMGMNSQGILAFDQHMLDFSQPVPGYNLQVPGHNQQVPGHNQQVPGYKQQVPGYNQPVPGYSQQVPGFNQLVPFQLDPAVSALPSLSPTLYPDAAPYMQWNDPAAFLEQGTGTQGGNVMPSLNQSVSSNAMQSNAAKLFGQGGGLNMPFMMPM